MTKEKDLLGYYSAVQFEQANKFLRLTLNICKNGEGEKLQQKSE